MPYRTIPGTDASYVLMAVNAQGGEQAPDPDWPQGPISERAIRTVVVDGITDVFLWSHGWKGDMRDAVDQYDRWIGAFAARAGDRAQMLQRQPGFKDMHIGFHWPSLAWGDESLAAGASFAPGAGASVQSLEDHYASELGDTPGVRAALHKLFAHLRTHSADYDLTDEAREAYLELDQALALGDGGPPGDGAADRVKFDPDQALVDNDDDNAAFGGGALASRLLAPLRQLTFWTMKKRAKTVGEDGLHPLLVKLQHAAPALRIHLMGHSFGCIVMSSAVLGRQAGAALPRPIDSCVLVQGATSLWAFARSNPLQSDLPGYFSNILVKKLVRGPLVCTQSKYDYAVGKIYPWAAGVANQVSFGLPLFGAIGAHGMCGIADAKALLMHAEADAYQLAPGGVYNVDGSNYIRKLDGVSGAHSDIDGPEVAHLIWQAAMCAQEAA